MNQNVVVAVQPEAVPTDRPIRGGLIDPVKFLQIMQAALQYLAEGGEPANAHAIVQSHLALDRQFEAGRRHGYEEALRDARAEAEAFIERIRRGEAP